MKLYKKHNLFWTPKLFVAASSFNLPSADIMDFRTPITIKAQQPKIEVASKIFLMGSCFVENIGHKLQEQKFQILQNPFGIFFHPLAITRFFQQLNAGKEYAEADIFQHNEQWHSFEAHSALSRMQKDLLLKELNKNLAESGKFLKDSSHIIITLGTAWVYRHLKTNKVVANCHKLPQKDFSKEILSIQQIKKSLSQLLTEIRGRNPKACVIFTISPVRHKKDGFVENQRSKSHLFSALHEVLEEAAGTDNTFYFPSYEILMDELRDYRFYEADMLHPNQTAINFVWQRFQESWFSENARLVGNEVLALQKRLQHKVFNKNATEYKKFLAITQQKIEKLEQKHPSIKF